MRLGEWGGMSAKNVSNTHYLCMMKKFPQYVEKSICIWTIIPFLLLLVVLLNAIKLHPLPSSSPITFSLITSSSPPSPPHLHPSWWYLGEEIGFPRCSD